MKFKNFIEESLILKQCAVIASLDVKGAFDAAWWPDILKQLREANVPRIYAIYQQVTLVIGKQHCP
jgi:hypothetical protein